MRLRVKSHLMWIPIFILMAFFLFSCAPRIKSTQPEEKPSLPAATKEELPKAEAKEEVKPEVKEEVKPEAKPEVKLEPEPSIKETPLAPPRSRTAETTSTPVPQVTQEPAPHTTEIALGLVNLREGPGTNHKIIRVLKKGTELIILEDKSGWLRVRLGEGVEGWVAKSTTLEGIQPSPPVPPKVQK